MKRLGALTVALLLLGLGYAALGEEVDGDLTQTLSEQCQQAPWATRRGSPPKTIALNCIDLSIKTGDFATAQKVLAAAHSLNIVPVISSMWIPRKHRQMNCLGTKESVVKSQNCKEAPRAFLRRSNKANAKDGDPVNPLWVTLDQATGKEEVFAYCQRENRLELWTGFKTAFPRAFANETREADAAIEKLGGSVAKKRDPNLASEDCHQQHEKATAEFDQRHIQLHKAGVELAGSPEEIREGDILEFMRKSGNRDYMRCAKELFKEKSHKLAMASIEQQNSPEERARREQQAEAGRALSACTNQCQDDVKKCKFDYDPDGSKRQTYHMFLRKGHDFAHASAEQNEIIEKLCACRSQYLQCNKTCGSPVTKGQDMVTKAIAESTLSCD